MQKKLTITIDEAVYAGLHAIIGRGNISHFLERIARPYLFPENLEAAYKEMASDKQREVEADAWTEGLIGEVLHETR